MVDLNIPGLSGITGVFNSPWLNPLVWVVIVVVVIVFVFGVVKLRKMRNLCYPAAELVDLGMGKTSINFLGKHGAGWFGKKRILFGLWDQGPDEVMRTKDMEIIEQFSEVDFQDVNGKRGVIFYRDPDTKALIPVHKLEVANSVILATLCPAEFTQRAVEILQANKTELMNKFEKWAPVLMVAGVIVFAVVALIIVSQIHKHAVTESKEMITLGFQNCLEAGKMMCSQIGLPPASGAP